MGAKWTYTTEEERQKIKMMFDMGISFAEIKRVTGRGNDLLYSIKNGCYEKRREEDRKRDEEKRNAIRENLRREAAAAGAASVTQDVVKTELMSVGTPVDAKVIPSPFDNERLLMRVADSNDYTNALLNGILHKLCKIAEALGV